MDKQWSAKYYAEHSRLNPTKTKGEPIFKIIPEAKYVFILKYVFTCHRCVHCSAIVIPPRGSTGSGNSLINLFR
jgi:hypothetical protein